MDMQGFLAWEAASRDTIDVKRCYIDVAGDLVAGVLLSQIVFWHLRGRDGQQRLNVQRDGHWWLAKPRTAWWDECRISPKQFDRACGVLDQNGKHVIVSAVYRFHGETMKHVRVDWDVFVPVLASVVEAKSGITQTVNPELPKSEVPNPLVVDPRIPESGSPSEREISGKDSKTETQTLNVEVRDLKILSKDLVAEPINEIVRLTGDEGSRKRFGQLYSIAKQNQVLELWLGAYAATKARMEKTTEPLDRPGAYFNATLGSMLMAANVYVPAGDRDQRKQVRALIDAGLDHVRVD